MIFRRGQKTPRRRRKISTHVFVFDAAYKDIETLVFYKYKIWIKKTQCKEFLLFPCGNLKAQHNWMESKQGGVRLDGMGERFFFHDIAKKGPKHTWKCGIKLQVFPELKMLTPIFEPQTSPETTGPPVIKSGMNQRQSLICVKLYDHFFWPTDSCGITPIS